MNDTGALGWANDSDQTPAALDSAMRQDASSRLSASVLFVLGFAFTGSSALVAKQSNEVVSVHYGVLKGWQGSFRNSVSDIALGEIQQSQQFGDTGFNLSPLPRRSIDSVSHPKVPYLKNLFFGEGGVDVPRLAMMGIERVIESEQSASKPMASDAGLLSPANEPSADNAENSAEEPREKVSHYVVYWLGGLAALALVLIEYSRWEADRWMRREYGKFWEHMKLPINRSRHSDGSVNVRWTNDPDQATARGGRG